MMLGAEQRRALALLANPGHDGATQPFLIARGFGGAMISRLGDRGFVTLTRERIRAGGNMIYVSTAANRTPARSMPDN